MIKLQFSPGVDQLLGVNQRLHLYAGRHPFYACFCVLFWCIPFFFFLFSVSDGKIQKKLVVTQKQMISTSERLAEHPFGGQNITQEVIKVSDISPVLTSV